MKKIYALITTLLSVFNLIGQAPTYQWAKPIGGTIDDNGYSITVDGSGNVYTTGYFQGTVDFDPGAGTFTMTSNVRDIFISKLDAAGNLVWAKKIGGSNDDYGYGIALDASGNVYTTGDFGGTVDFDPGAGTYNLTASARDVFVSKLDASGNFVWAKQLGGNGGTIDDGRSIAVDASGNVYTSGYFQGTSDYDPGAGIFNLVSAGLEDIFVSKLDASGNFVWAKQLGGPSTDNGFSIAVDAGGNVLTTGLFAGIADFDPGAGTFTLSASGPNTDAFVSKLDGSGNFVWAKQLGGGSIDRGYGITVDPSGNVYTTGYFTSTADFDPGAGSFFFNSFGSNDIFVSKLNAAGNFVWAKQMGGTFTDDGKSVFVDALGNVFTTGYFYGTSDFDPGLGTFNLSSNAGSYDVFVSKLDTSGNFSWAVKLGGTIDDRGHDIFVNSTGNVYVSGEFMATTDFDPGAGVSNLISVGNSDAFTLKLADCAAAPSQPTGISGIASICSGSTATYSVPVVAGATSYTWSLPGGWSGLSTTNTISATPGTTGIFTVTASNACGTSPQQTLNVTVNPSPTITVNSGSICSGSSFTIVPSGANTYTIQGGSSIVSPTANASYTVVGTSTASCISASPATSNVTVNPLPTLNVSTTNTILCVGQSATLTASGATSYTFNPGGPGSSIVVSPTVTTTYTVNGVDINGCSNSTSFTQSVSICSGVQQMTNANSEIRIFPNPTTGEFFIKGINDFNSVHVYNTLGEEVVSTHFPFREGLWMRLEQPNGIYFIRIGNVTTKIIKE